MDKTGNVIKNIIATELKAFLDVINKRFDGVDKRFDKVEKDAVDLRDKLASVAGDVASIKVDIKYMQTDTSSFSKNFQQYKDSFLTKLDQNLGELKKSAMIKQLSQNNTEGAQLPSKITSKDLKNLKSLTTSSLHKNTP